MSNSALGLSRSECCLDEELSKVMRVTTPGKNTEWACNMFDYILKGAIVILFSANYTNKPDGQSH